MTTETITSQTKMGYAWTTDFHKVPAPPTAYGGKWHVVYVPLSGPTIEGDAAEIAAVIDRRIRESGLFANEALYLNGHQVTSMRLTNQDGDAFWVSADWHPNVYRTIQELLRGDEIEVELA